MEDDLVLIDRTHLLRQVMGDLDLQRELLTLFRGQMIEKKAELLARNADLGLLAHTIKGSAKGIGAWQLAEVAFALEGQVAETEKADLVDRLVMMMDETLKDVELLMRQD